MDPQTGATTGAQFGTSIFTPILLLVLAFLLYRGVRGALWQHILRRYTQQGEPFPSFAAFCKERQPFGLGYPPEVIERLIGERTIAQSARERVRDAVDKTTGEILPEGRPSVTAQIAQLSQVDRAADIGISRRQQQKLDRLARDFPEQYAHVRDGSLSPHAAAVQVGIVKQTMTVPFDPTEAAQCAAHHTVGLILTSLATGLVALMIVFTLTSYAH